MLTFADRQGSFSDFDCSGRNMSFTTTVISEHTSPVRKNSALGKMFDGFKFQNDKEEKDDQPAVDPFTSSGKKQSVTSEKALGNFSVNQTAPLDEPKRSLSVALLSDIFRRGSEASTKSRSSSPVRKGSTSSSGRKGSFFHSSNPDVDSEAPRKMSTHSKHSHTDSRNNSVNEPNPNDPARRPSYVPKNATSSFLTSTTQRNAEQRAKIQQDVSAIGAARSASIAASDASDLGFGSGRTGSVASANGSVTTPTGRRPSGMVPNTVASRYMRTASQTEEDKSTNTASDQPSIEGSGDRRRRPSNRSRQGSRDNVNSDTKIQPVYLPPDAHQHWQNSVNRSMQRFPFAKPGETMRKASMAGMADIEESGEAGSSPAGARSASKERKASAIAGAGVKERKGSKDSKAWSINGRKASQTSIGSANNSTTAAPELKVSPATPQKVKKQVSIDTMKANSDVVGKTLDGGRGDSAKYIEDSVSPLGSTFGPSIYTNLDKSTEEEEEEEELERPETPLESLGFRGAVPA